MITTGDTITAAYLVTGFPKRTGQSRCAGKHFIRVTVAHEHVHETIRRFPVQHSCGKDSIDDLHEYDELPNGVLVLKYEGIFIEKGLF